MRRKRQKSPRQANLTQSDVETVAQALFQETGRRPETRDIRARLRRGSNGTIQRMMLDWQPTYQSVERLAYAGIPSELHDRLDRVESLVGKLSKRLEHLEGNVFALNLNQRDFDREILSLKTITKNLATIRMRREELNEGRKTEDNTGEPDRPDSPSRAEIADLIRTVMFILQREAVPMRARDIHGKLPDMWRSRLSQEALYRYLKQKRSFEYFSRKNGAFSLGPDAEAAISKAIAVQTAVPRTKVQIARENTSIQLTRILEILNAANGPLTADEVHYRLSDTTLSRKQVYRAMYNRHLAESKNEKHGVFHSAARTVLFQDGLFFAPRKLQASN